MKALKKIAKILFLIFTLYLIIPYSIALQMKIEQPNFKNLDTKSFIFLGIILLVLISINIKLFFPNLKISLKNKSTNL
jgi:hypothetical protein